MLLCALARTPAAAATGEAPSGPSHEAQQYEECLALAHSDPQRAYADATSWQAIGGGFPAEHCVAVALIGLKKYAEAARRLEDLASAMMRAQPAIRAETLAQAAQAWLLADEPGKAKTALDAALAYEPKNPDLLIDRAEALGFAKKYFDAIDDLNRALELAPKRVDALVYRATAYRELGSLDLALDDADRALRLDPNNVPGLLERGNIERLKDDNTAAKADWDRVVRLAPASPEAQAAKNNLARLAGGPSLAKGPAAAEAPREAASH